MAERSDQTKTHLGFLTAQENEEMGFTGGLLLTSRLGRPLEFQCTSPIQPNKSQQILYGPTLRPYLMGELIGKTLLDRAEIKPQLLMTNLAEMLDLRTHISIPIVRLVLDQDGLPVDQDKRESGQHQVGQWTVEVSEEFVSDVSRFEEIVNQLPEKADLAEPLSRVGDALLEAIRPGAAA